MLNKKLDQRLLIIESKWYQVIANYLFDTKNHGAVFSNMPNTYWNKKSFVYKYKEYNNNTPAIIHPIYREDALMINDIWFTVPPENISVSVTNQHIDIPYVRGKNRIKLDTGFNELSVTITINFTGDLISGRSINDELLYKLTPLLVQIEHFPIIHIYNEYIQKQVLDYITRDVSKEDIDKIKFNQESRSFDLLFFYQSHTVETISQDIIKLTLNLLLFNYSPFLNKVQFVGKYPRNNDGTILRLNDKKHTIAVSPTPVKLCEQSQAFYEFYAPYFIIREKNCEKLGWHNPNEYDHQLDNNTIELFYNIYIPISVDIYKAQESKRKARMLKERQTQLQVVSSIASSGITKSENAGTKFYGSEFNISQESLATSFLADQALFYVGKMQEVNNHPLGDNDYFNILMSYGWQPGQQWCAYFVTMVVDQVIKKNNNLVYMWRPWDSNVGNIVRSAQDKKYFDTTAKRERSLIFTPDEVKRGERRILRGDLAYWIKQSDDNPERVQRHIGFVDDVTVDSNGNIFIYFISGNSTKKYNGQTYGDVTRKKISIDNFTGFIRVPIAQKDKLDAAINNQTTQQGGPIQWIPMTNNNAVQNNKDNTQQTVNEIINKASQIAKKAAQLDTAIQTDSELADEVAQLIEQMDKHKIKYYYLAHGNIYYLTIKKHTSINLSQNGINIIDIMSNNSITVPKIPLAEHRFGTYQYMGGHVKKIVLQLVINEGFQYELDKILQAIDLVAFNARRYKNIAYADGIVVKHGFLNKILNVNRIIIDNYTITTHPDIPGASLMEIVATDATSMYDQIEKMNEFNSIMESIYKIDKLTEKESKKFNETEAIKYLQKFLQIVTIEANLENNLNPPKGQNTERQTRYITVNYSYSITPNAFYNDYYNTIDMLAQRLVAALNSSAAFGNEYFASKMTGDYADIDRVSGDFNLEKFVLVGYTSQNIPIYSLFSDRLGLIASTFKFKLGDYTSDMIINNSDLIVYFAHAEYGNSALTSALLRFIMLNYDSVVKVIDEQAYIDNALEGKRKPTSTKRQENIIYRSAYPDFELPPTITPDYYFYQPYYYANTKKNKRILDTQEKIFQNYKKRYDMYKKTLSATVFKLKRDQYDYNEHVLYKMLLTNEQTLQTKAEKDIQEISYKAYLTNMPVYTNVSVILPPTTVDSIYPNVSNYNIFTQQAKLDNTAPNGSKEKIEDVEQIKKIIKDNHDEFYILNGNMFCYENESSPTIPMDYLKEESDNSIDNLVNNISQTLVYCFPAYAVYVIEEDDTTFTYPFLQDLNELYGMNCIQEITIMESGDPTNPLDVAYITINDVSGKFTSQKYKPVIKTERKQIKLIDTPKENNLDGIMLREGVRIQIRLGYSNNPNDLEIKFNGEIVSMSGETNQFEIICQSYAAEFLVDTIAPDKPYVIGEWESETKEIFDYILNHPSVKHFGRWKLSSLDNLLFSDSTNGLVPGVYSRVRPDGKTQLLWTWTKNEGIMNILAPDEGALAGIGDWIEAIVRKWTNVFSLINFPELSDFVRSYVAYKTTLWQIADDMTYRYPGTVCRPLPFEDRMTLFYGPPMASYFYRKMTADEKEFILNAKLDIDRTKNELYKNIDKLNARKKEILDSVQQYKNDPFRHDLVLALESLANLDKYPHSQEPFYSAGIKETLERALRGIHDEIKDKIINEYIPEIINLNAAIRTNQQQIDYINNNFGSKTYLIETIRRQAKKIFKQFHIADSSKNIIFNKIRADYRDTYTQVTVQYSKPQTSQKDSPEDINDYDWADDTLSLKLNDFLFEEDIRTIYKESYNVIGETGNVGAYYYATQELWRQAKGFYKGTLMTIGLPSVKPYDTILLYDYHNSMIGPIEVGNHVITINPIDGMISDIEPRATAYVNDIIYLSGVEVFLYELGLLGTKEAFEGGFFGLGSAALFTTAGVSAARALLGTTLTTGIAISPMAWLVSIGIALSSISLGVKVIAMAQFRQPIFIQPLLYYGQPFLYGINTYNTGTLWQWFEGRAERFVDGLNIAQENVNAIIHGFFNGES